MAYKPRLPLKKHQLAYLEASRNKPPVPCSEDCFAALCDMGTGKSAMVLAEWGEMATNGGAKDLLLIAPKGSIRNWYHDKNVDDPSQWSELRKHVDPDFRERLIDCTWVGSGKEWERRIAAMLRTKDKQRPRALFVNVEALSNPKNDEALKLCLEFVEQRGAHVVIDESTTVKGASNRTDAAIQIGSLARSRRILSGLWTPKSPMDLFWQCKFLSDKILGYDNYYTFRRRYAVLKRMQVFIGRDNRGNEKYRKFDQIVGFQNMEELQDKVAKYSYRVLKKDCLDLEPKVYTTRDVEMTREQKQMFKELKHFGHAAIGDTGKFVTTDMVIKRIMREIQITCGFVMDDEDRVLHEVPENKTAALLEVLSEHNGKAIIWTPWRAPLDKIVKRLSKEFGPQSVAQFHGGNTKTRGEEESRFLSDPECLYMVATQGAGMRGNTWTNASLTVYYANSYDLEHRDQSEDRNHRIGQVNRVTYVDLITQGTIENKVVQSLRKKIDLATLINREGYREWVV